MFLPEAGESVSIQKRIMSNLMETLASKIPDFKEIVDIFNGMVAQHKEDTANIEDTRKTCVNELNI